jgi:hypothetical protein
MWFILKKEQPIQSVHIIGPPLRRNYFPPGAERKISAVLLVPSGEARGGRHHPGPVLLVRGLLLVAPEDAPSLLAPLSGYDEVPLLIRPGGVRIHNAASLRASWHKIESLPQPLYQLLFVASLASSSATWPGLQSRLSHQSSRPSEPYFGCTLCCKVHIYSFISVSSFFICISVHGLSYVHQCILSHLQYFQIRFSSLLFPCSV